MNVTRYKQDNILTLICQEEAFAVHQSIVCNQSGVLKTACDSHFKEGLTKMIEVNFDTETLQRMLDFMYRGKYDGPGLKPPEPPVCDNESEQGDKSEPVTDAMAEVATEETTEEKCEVSNINDESAQTMLDMLRPHILVNSIADYYDVPELKKQANANVRYILTHSWSADDIAPAVELAFESTLDTTIHKIMATTVADHLTELIDREDFIRHKIFNQFSLGIIQEGYKNLLTSEHKVKLAERETLNLKVAGEKKIDWYKAKVSELEETIGKVKDSIEVFSSVRNCRFCNSGAQKMNRLPTEIYDRIIYYVEVLGIRRDSRIFSLRELCHWPVSYSARPQGHRALTVLRLVDKAFCRSASRALFRHITIRTNFGPTFIPWFEEFSSSHCALYVRYLVFALFTGEEEGGGGGEEEEDDGHRYIKLPDEVSNRLPSLLAKFVNLSSIHIWSYVQGWEIKWVPPILRSIAKLPFRNLTQLGLGVGDIPYLQDLFDNSNHNTAVMQFAQRIQHLHLLGSFESEDNMFGLNILFDTTTDLRSLSIMGDGPDFPGLGLDKIKLSQASALKYLELSCIYISSNHLLALLEQYTESLMFLSLDDVYLTSGSWLHVLSQINKNLKLFTFLFTHNPFGEDREEAYQDLGRSLDLFCNEDLLKLTWCAHGDVHRQISANRLAAGLEPWPDPITNDFLSRPPLRSVMRETQYQELISRSWDFEEHSDEW